MATISFGTTFDLTLTPKQFIFNDSSDYAGQGISTSDVNGSFKITSPSGIVIYNNAVYSDGGCDIKVSSALTNQTTVGLPLASNGLPEIGTYTILYTVYDKNLATYYTITNTYTNAYAQPDVEISQIVDCLSPIFSSIDITDYVVNGITPVIVRTNTIDYPYGSAGQGSPTIGSTATVTTSTFYQGTQTTQIASGLTYTFLDGLIVIDSIAGAKEVLVDCKDTCGIYCCVRSLEQRMQGYLTSNTQLYEETSQQFSVIMGLVGLVMMSIRCGKSADTNGYLTLLKQLANCTDDCDCSGTEPTQVVGIGGLINNVIVVSGSPSFVVVTPVVVGNTTTYTITIDPSLIANINKVWTQIFADDAARAAAVPDFDGQLGTQIDTDTVYEAVGLNAGDWVQVNFFKEGAGSGSLMTKSANGATGGASIAAGNSASSAGDNSIALGAAANSNGDDSVSIGLTTAASGNRAISIGSGTSASTEDSVAIGFTANASAIDGIAIGKTSISNGLDSVAIGTSAHTSGINSIAIGKSVFSSATGALSIGVSASASAANTISLGNATVSSGVGAISLGDTANAAGIASVVIGTSSYTTLDYAISLGYSVQSTGLASIAIGKLSNANATDAISIGVGSSANSDDTISLGHLATASTNGAIAIGSSASGSGQGGMAIGNSSTTSQTDAIAFGSATTSSGVGSIAIGGGSTADADSATAIGQASEAHGISSNALGVSAIARIEATTNISGTIITRKDSGETPFQQFFSGSVVTITTNEVNLKNIADYTITIPAGAIFFPDEVDLILTTTTTNVTGQPTVRAGGDVSTASLLAAVATTALTLPNHRQRFATLLTATGQQTLTAGVTVAATGTTVKGRFVFSGRLIEIE